MFNPCDLSKAVRHVTAPDPISVTNGAKLIESIEDPINGPRGEAGVGAGGGGVHQEQTAACATP
jgi:hypothetical protein